jgi:anti-anti-sigma factor
MATHPLEFRKFRIITRRLPTGTTVRCSGELTGDTASILEDEVLSVIPKATVIEIDLGAVTHIDGAAANIVSDLCAAAKSEGCTVRWKCGDGRVRRKLQVVRLSSVFREYGQYL